MMHAARGRGISRWGVLAALAALLLTAGAWTYLGGRLFAPAGLSAAAGDTLGGVSSHAELAADCAACHPAPWSRERMDERCVRCHSDVRRELADSTSLHGSLPDGTRCRACHTEHHGAQGSLTSMDARSLDHATFGFALDTHREAASGNPFACGDCHQPNSFAFRPADCEDCHREYQPAFTAEHAATWGSDCRSCHDGTGARFAHTFPIDHGSRSASECTVCHEGAPREYRSYTCYGCHEHTPANIRAEHREEGISDAELVQCVRCHEGGGEHDGRGERSGRSDDRDSH